MIPASSPIAQKFLHDNPELSSHGFSDATTEGSGNAAFILVTILVVGVGGYFLLPGRHGSTDSSTSLPASTPSVALTAPSVSPATTAAAVPAVTDSTPADAPPPRSAAPTNLKRFSTVAEAQQEALRLYPALGVAGSPFNREFVARHKKYQQERPDYLRDTGWPVSLAREVATTVNSQ